MNGQQAETPQQQPTPTGAVKSYEAQYNEATQRTFQFELGGRVWAMASPDSADWQLSANAQSGDGQAQKDLLANLLGPEQWSAFYALPGVSAKLLTQILQDCATHYGVDLGESAASPRS